MGEKLKDRAPEDLPGPGNYDYKSKIQEGPAYSLYPKRDTKYNDNPGPGQYEHSDVKGKGVKIGEKLKDRAPEDLPGPGNYDQQTKIGEGPKYSMYDKRDQKYNDNPGPGQYEASESKRKPITIGEKLKERAPEDMPGPGNYDQKSKIQEGPQYSIYGRRDDKYNDNPGPG